MITNKKNNKTNELEELSQIKYYYMNYEINILFDETYKTLCKDKEYQFFINTGIYGRINNKIFAIYNNQKEKNKLCIVFIDGQEKYVICIDSKEINLKNKNNHLDIEKYIDSCCYYSITKFEKMRSVLSHIEVKELKKQNKKFFKKTWTYYNKNYEVIAKEEDNCFRYEIKVSQNSGNVTITSVWDNYTDFDNEQNPKKVILNDNKEKIIKGTYEEIHAIAPQYGLSLKYEGIREYLRRGEYIDPIIPNILYDFFENEKYIEQRNQITKYINPKEISKVYYNEDAIQETRYISKRYSIEKRDKRP